MSLSTLFAALLYFGGIVAVIVGLRSFLTNARSPHVELRSESELRRSARLERIEAATPRRLRVVERHEEGPDAA